MQVTTKTAHLGCSKCKTATPHRFKESERFRDSFGKEFERDIFHCENCGDERQWGANRGQMSDPGGLYFWPWNDKMQMRASA